MYLPAYCIFIVELWHALSYTVGYAIILDSPTLWKGTKLYAIA